MKTCLATMHHSTLRAGCSSTTKSSTSTNTKSSTTHSSSKLKQQRDLVPDERRINVELTAGGGGNTAHRRDKIRVKNERLAEQRARRAQEQAKAKAGKKAGGGDKDKKEKEKEDDGGAGAVHPSRQGRIAGL
ncbi:hypothetical protein GGR56DRAFT_639732 [Xylariaceae sp. FL0804]|nr:hypothetical protein GGR56DRAFT_639732 [Xylariaceae sp. FL0804]